MRKKYAATFIVAVLIVGGGLFAWGQNHASDAGSTVVEKAPVLSQQKQNQEKQAAQQDRKTAAASDTKTQKPSQSTNGKAVSSGQAVNSKTSVHQSSGDKSSESAAKGSSKTGGKNNFINTYSVEHVVSNPESIAVLVNKTYRLPAGYVPSDLVYPNVPFTFSEKLEKRKMRREAAVALEKMFAAAKKDGISLAGVSGYRSESRQTTLYNNYAKKDGVKAADTYSARSGHSEHQTGLAIDVSGITGKCAAQSCFSGTKEAKWLAEHAQEYGFIIRYPEGKDAITGYKYEPWHIRYVGTKLADEVTSRYMTLEQYFGSSVPVSK